jgi:hypothetical protein
MATIVSLTAATGFLASVLLLYAGVDALWMRYAIAVVCAYVAFLFFIRCWLWLRQGGGLDVDFSLRPTSSSGQGPTANFQGGGGGQCGGGGASGSFDSPVDTSDVVPSAPSWDSTPSGSGGGGWGFDFDLDLGELALVLVLLVLLAGALWSVISVVSSAPSLLGELLVDAGLAGALYRGPRRSPREYWMRTVLRRTALQFVVAAAAFALAGFAMQWHAPEAKSFADVASHHSCAAARRASVEHASEIPPSCVLARR